MMDERDDWLARVDIAVRETIPGFEEQFGNTYIDDDGVIPSLFFACIGTWLEQHWSRLDRAMAERIADFVCTLLVRGIAGASASEADRLAFLEGITDDRFDLVRAVFAFDASGRLLVEAEPYFRVAQGRG